MSRQPIDIDFTLRRVFGKKSFRPLQREVISAAIEGDDVFLQAATSFGKSLCFQLPAIVAHGVTVVVSPLLSLMVDQVVSLEARGIPVETINSTTPKSKRRTILADILSGHPVTRLLYVTPEFCLTESFRRSILKVHSQGELVRVAIDEAHCVSEWGHDFRPAYKALSWFRQELKNPIVPMTALTATATTRVRSDIITILGLDPATLKKFSTSSSRPNIHYEVKYFPHCASDLAVPEASQVEDLLSWLGAIHDRRVARLSMQETILSNDSATDPPVLPPMTGIIYVPLRALCDGLAQSLNTCSEYNIIASSYHAGLAASEREKIQKSWAATHKVPTQRGTSTSEPKQKHSSPAFYIVVATNAFGMGIDNPHVRFVVHWTPPRTFESFVQESGRAGRDGRAAISLVYYNPSECIRVIDRIRQNGDYPREMLSMNGKGGFRNMAAGRARTIAEAKALNHEALLVSFAKVIQYCETTNRCRHDVIQEYSDDLESELRRQQSHPSPSGAPGAGPGLSSQKPSLCDYACDFCKEGTVALTKRKQKHIGPNHTSREEDEERNQQRLDLMQFVQLYRRGIESV